MSHFVHPRAICESDRIGDETRIDAFAYVEEKAVVGEQCRIANHSFIGGGVVIGDRVTVDSGVHLRQDVHIEDDASVGVNATILPGVKIGQKSLVGAGAVVTRSVPPNAIVVGNPARIIGYVDSPRGDRDTARIPNAVKEGERVRATSVPGVTTHHLPAIRDMRGSLSVAEFEDDICFVPKRAFMVFDVPNREVRGEHAHRECHLFLICVKGSCAVVADDGEKREEFLLDRPHFGIYLPPMIWGIQ